MSYENYQQDIINIKFFKPITNPVDLTKTFLIDSWFYPLKFCFSAMTNCCTALFYLFQASLSSLCEAIDPHAPYEADNQLIFAANFLSAAIGYAATALLVPFAILSRGACNLIELIARDLNRNALTPSKCSA